MKFINWFGQKKREKKKEIKQGKLKKKEDLQKIESWREKIWIVENTKNVTYRHFPKIDEIIFNFRSTSFYQTM